MWCFMSQDNRLPNISTKFIAKNLPNYFRFYFLSAGYWHVSAELVHSILNVLGNFVSLSWRVAHTFNDLVAPVDSLVADTTNISLWL